VQAGAGIELHAKPGDTVTAGQPLMTLHTDTPERFARAIEIAETAAVIEDTNAFEAPKLIIDRIS
jgi:thymidine phosphorylase